MNKKYLPSALILYLNYFIHGVGCSILGQAVIKDALATAWGVEAMAITAISAALGLGRLIALPFAGPLSDKLGRRISTAIGSASYAIYLIGLALAFNAGTSGGYTIAYVCAIIGGIANSFLDTCTLFKCFRSEFCNFEKLTTTFKSSVLFPISHDVLRNHFTDT